MFTIPRLLGLLLGCILVVLSSFSASPAQNISFNYKFSFEPTLFTKPPQMGGLEIAFPEVARKNGVEGTVRVDFTLGEDGKVRDIVIVNDLPFGVGDAAKEGLSKFTFKPAEDRGKRVPMGAHLDYIITLAYGEDDKNVTRPQITERPDPEYPENQRAAKIKGKVLVTAIFYADGTLKVLGTNSVMPQEFDKAAAAAAAKIRFSPAIHKKSKKPVTQQLSVEYEFKP